MNQASIIIETTFVFILLKVIITMPLTAQTFGPPQIITKQADGARSVYAIDLNCDGKLDVLSASSNDNTIAWYENKLEEENTFIMHVITDTAFGARVVYAANLDEDDDIDVLSASSGDDQIRWYENRLNDDEGFVEHSIASFTEALTVHVADIDGENGLDVLSASSGEDQVVWYPNDGRGNFGPQRIIASSVDLPFVVYAADLNGDDDIDVLSASRNDITIAWYKSVGDTTFQQKIIDDAAGAIESIYVADLDGNKKLDVLSASSGNNTISWYKNEGNEEFGNRQVITPQVPGANSVFAIDLDGDGDMDVLSASRNDDKIAWYQNDGLGNFDPDGRPITTEADNARAVYAADIDGDGDPDVLSASFKDSTIAWYENTVFLHIPTLEETTNVQSDQFTVNWSGRDAVAYEVDVATDSTFTQLVENYEKVRIDTPAVSFQVTGLEPNQKYYYRMRSINVLNAISANTTVDSVTTFAELTIEEPTPTGFTARWLAVSGVTFYRVEVATNPDFTQNNTTLEVSDTSAVISNLPTAATSTYYCRVQAITNEQLISQTEVVEISLPVPRLTGISSNTADVGQTVSIMGSNFNSNQEQVTVEVGNLSLQPEFLNSEGDSISFIVPSLCPGTYNLFLIVGSQFSDSIFFTIENNNIQGGRFGPPKILTDQADGAWDVYAADLDGDGDMDVLSASDKDDRVDWYENKINDGIDFEYPERKLITDQADGAHSVYAAKLDEDDDIDVLSASSNDNTIAWYENKLEEEDTFIMDVITSQANDAHSVYVADLNDDKFLDVLSASFQDNKIAWYENTGNENELFGEDQNVIDSLIGAISVYAADLNKDSKMDILSANASSFNFYLNDGEGKFRRHRIDTVGGPIPGGAWDIYVADLNGDKKLDVLTAAGQEDKIAWYEYTMDAEDNFTFNLGGIITKYAAGVFSIHAADLDRDGDMDVLSASRMDNKVAWYENEGDGTFGEQQIITCEANTPYSVYAADLNGDYSLDVLSASRGDNTIAWYKNKLGNKDTSPATIFGTIFPPDALHPLSSDLNLEVQASDEGDFITGITTYTFKYAGLTQDFASENQEKTITVTNENHYTIKLTPEELSMLNDTLGVYYQFEFTDAAGNKKDTTGATYWKYDEAFSSNNAKYPWRQINDRSDKDLILGDYNILAFPFEPQSVSEVLAELGDPDIKHWRLFRYETATDTFPEYGKGNFTVGSKFEPNQGYFLIWRNLENDTIHFGGTISRMEEAATDTLAHMVTLQKGWNLLGNPFPFAIDWLNVKNDPLNNNIKDKLLRLNLLNGGSNYVKKDTLKPFEGAFLYWDESNAATLYLHPSVQCRDCRRDSHHPTKGWEVAIVVGEGRQHSARAGIGMHPDATEGLDWYDALQVPKPQGQAELVINHVAYLMNRSVVEPQASYIWSAEVVGSVGAEIQLSWDAQQVGHLSNGLYLWDDGRQNLVKMNQQGEYHLVLPEGGRMPLKLYYGSQTRLVDVLDIKQVQVGLAYPNPVSYQTVKLPVVIPEGQVGEGGINIYDPQGRLVQKFSLGVLPTGYNALEINLLEQLSSGLYHYRLQINGQTYPGRLLKQ